MEESIATVMKKYAESNPKMVNYYFFDQAQYPGIDKGVCHALCKIWVKTIDKIPSYKFREHAASRMNQAKGGVIFKQKKYESGGEKVDRFSGSTTVSQMTILNQKYANEHGKNPLVIMQHMKTMLNDETPLTPSEISTVLKLMINEDRNKFWEDFAKHLMPSAFGDSRAKIGTIKYGEYKHDIATCRTDQGVRFFEPNGGILEFRDPDCLSNFLEFEYCTAGRVSATISLEASIFTPKT